MSASHLKNSLHHDNYSHRVYSSMPKLQIDPKEIKRSIKNPNFFDKYLATENDSLDNTGKEVVNMNNNQYININMD